MTRPTCTILFQGDSITDTGRARSVSLANDPSAMGNGYAFLAMCRLLATRPSGGVAVYNRGISGHRVPDLQARWQEDCVDLAPDVLGILIGVNDIWHKLEGRSAGTVADYESGFHALLEQTRRALPRTHLIVGEPFVLRCGAVTERWFPEFDERRSVAARVARAAGARFVPFQTVFDRAVQSGSAPAYWAADGVHPSPAGHQLMADAWLPWASGAGSHASERTLAGQPPSPARVSHSARDRPTFSAAPTISLHVVRSTAMPCASQCRLIRRSGSPGSSMASPSATGDWRTHSR
jgi:lysophospholipase L1-like esterase